MGNLTHFSTRTAASLGIDLVLKKVTKKDREEEMVKLVNLMEKYMEDDQQFSMDYDEIRSMVRNPDDALNQFLNRALDEIDPHVLKTSVLNLGFEAMLSGTKKMHKMREIHQCNIPWLILMDPTSACNLHCTGCWAAEYGNKLNLTYDEMSNVVKQGKELGIFFYMFTGGEPLVRKDDLIRLCKEHKDCQFLAFTNGTLVDEAFCLEMKKVGNLMLAISLEGSPEVNDLRRGQGVYGKVMDAMDLLKKHGLIFGSSVCYSSKNCESVTSKEFVQLMVDKGCRYALYFHYMPVGNDASMDLLPSPEQRVATKNRIREIRNLKHGEGLFTIDFQNDGEYMNGCIAGGRNYFHINANGDAEPCVFIHYSDSNIRDHSLLEILKRPLFMAYHNNQPFNENHLRPCPMLENPEILQRIVKETGVKSTDLQSPESADHLCGKCQTYAENWKPCADKIWYGQEDSLEKSE
ncbi:pyrroloquinoline quinone biosynthesis protein PqqE [Urinicoccus massiliensis]|uniref:Pyrroloquinoline quinone biosynthesis protein PqqE n=1 Tax=Urinicoccus massiliensis TaxID=1723382 RepID=A0A8H2M3N7_9FIRM|nr:radical SAM protein [Urinicoccus massiliensis]VFB15571.1 pyrroloquinoline quinone biosynthesis protein PqqE [Urinicoccus massiliensis]